MPFRRKTSELIAAVQRHADSLTAIAPSLDLNNRFILAAFRARIAAAQASLDACSTLVERADAADGKFIEMEEQLRILSAARMLEGGGSRRVRDSGWRGMGGATLGRAPAGAPPEPREPAEMKAFSP